MAGLLDFGTDSSAGPPVTGDPAPGTGTVTDPSTTSLIFPMPAMSGAVTGVVNSLGQSVQAFFNYLPQQIGLAAPAPASPVAALLGEGALPLVGLALVAYLLLSEGKSRGRR